MRVFVLTVEGGREGGLKGVEGREVEAISWSAHYSACP